jgi:hypothetical protein
MVSKNTYTVVKRIVNKEGFTLSLLENGIVQLDFDDDFYDIHVGHLIDIEEGMKVIGEGKKMPFYFNSKDFLSIDNEALAYTKRTESGKFTLANAVLVDNSAKKILYNIYFGLKKRKAPTKAFDTKEDAFDWLLSLENK